MQEIYADIQKAKRIVVKVGTSTLIYDTGKVNLKRMDQLAMVLADLHNRGKEIILVSSGAVGTAMGKMGMAERPKEMRMKQALAAVGQCELMFLYDKFFSDYSNTVAQILLTRDDIAIPRRKRSMQDTIHALLELGIIPVINENDTVAVDEIEIGDNDILSAHVAKMMDADLLVLFSDIDGLYDADPRINPDAKLVSAVYDVDQVRYAAGGAGTARGTGGMVTKLNAAAVATDAGIHMVIANGSDISRLYNILEGKPEGTLFVSRNFAKQDGQESGD